MNDSKQALIAFFMGYLVLFYLIGLMLWPFITSIIFAGIIAGSFMPVMKYLAEKTNHPKWSAILVCLLIVLALFIPSIFIIIQLSEEALQLFQSIRAYLSEEQLEKFLLNTDRFPGFVKELFSLANLEMNVASVKGLLLEASKNASSTVFNLVNSWISNIFFFFFQFLIMLVVMYTLFVDGARIKEFFLALSPLPDDEEELVIEKFNQINYVTLVGNGIGGIIQGILAGIGFWMAGLQSIALWTTTMVVLAFIPLVGISIIYIPACIYLLIIGKTISSIILFVYCTFVAQVVENWFKPKFVGNRAKISSTLIFLSIFGGLSVFGVPGIFYGPLIISIFLTFVELYHKRYTKA